MLVLECMCSLSDASPVWCWQHGSKSDVATGWNDVMKLKIPIEDHHSKVWKPLAEYGSQKARRQLANQLKGSFVFAECQSQVGNEREWIALAIRG